MCFGSVKGYNRSFPSEDPWSCGDSEHLSDMFFDKKIGFGSVWFLAVLSDGWLGAGLRDGCGDCLLVLVARWRAAGGEGWDARSAPGCWL